MQKDLTQGSVFKTIVVFAFPFFISYFLQTLYGLADLFIVGQFEGADAIAAVSVGSQVMHMITVVIVGLSMGATVMIGRFVGAKDPKKTAKTIGNTVTLFTLIAIAATLILLCFVKPLVGLMFTPAEAVSQTEQYLCICFAGIPFITAYNIIGSIFRGMGDSKSPMYFIAVACVLNIALDYLFIGSFGMGAAGAALATVLAQTFSVAAAILFVVKRNMGISLSKGDFCLKKTVVGNIMKIGVPVSLQDTFIQFSFLLIAVIANTRGVDVAAAVGIVEKIIGILFLIPSSMLSSVSAIAAQNIGAGYHHRARKTLRYGVGLCVASGCFCALICQFIPETILGLFTAEPQVIVFGAQYLMAYSIDCIFAGNPFLFQRFFLCLRYVDGFLYPQCRFCGAGACAGQLSGGKDIYRNALSHGSCGSFGFDPFGVDLRGCLYLVP